MKRDYGFDNIKCILIFGVVLGHFLELSHCFGGDALYRLIYQLHMPAFVFVSGYFTRFGQKQVLEKIWLYVLFQTLYILFERFATGQATPIQYTTPYWILWYMLAMIFYSLLIPLYRAKTDGKRIVVLCASVLLALMVGFIKPIGYPLALSRFFVFQPYFLLGLYFRETEDRTCAKIKSVPIRTKGLAMTTVALVAVLLLAANLMDTHVQNRHLYGSYPYAGTADLFIRFRLMVVAVCGIALLLAARPYLSRSIPLVSRVGGSTLSVYLLHGFLMRAIRFGILPEPGSLLWIILGTAVCLLLLGNRYVSKGFAFLIPTKWRIGLRKT